MAWAELWSPEADKMIAAAELLTQHPVPIKASAAPSACPGLSTGAHHQHFNGDAELSGWWYLELFKEAGA